MAQDLGTHNALTEDPSSVPNSHVGHLTVTHNSRPRSSDNFYWPLCVCVFYRLFINFVLFYQHIFLNTYPSLTLRTYILFHFSLFYSKQDLAT